MRVSQYLVAGALGLFALAAVPEAYADTYVFTSDHCTGGCSTGASNMGTITVTQAGANSVAVHVELEAGFGFVSTGAGAGASFFFRLLGDPTITYSGITAGWTIPNVIPVNQQAAGAYAGDGLMNQFEYALNCDPPSGACGNGGSSPAPPPLDFTVTAAGLTVADFNDTGNASGSPFAADVLSANGNTGLIDASLGSVSGVPEPASVALFGSVLALAVIKIRQKRA